MGFTTENKHLIKRLWVKKCRKMIDKMACLSGAVGSVAVHAAWLWWSASLGSAAYALRLNSRAGTEGSTVSSLICDC